MDTALPYTSSARQDRQGNWPRLSARQLRVVIRLAGASERRATGLRRFLYRKYRRNAVTFYRRRFGDADFLHPYSGHELAVSYRAHVPGEAWWKYGRLGTLSTSRGF